MAFECSGCNEKFMKRTTFDTHRVGPWGDPIYKKSQVIGYTKPQRRCLSVDEMLEKGMKKNEQGLWLSGAEFPTGVFDGGKGGPAKTTSALLADLQEKQVEAALLFAEQEGILDVWEQEREVSSEDAPVQEDVSSD